MPAACCLSKIERSVCFCRMFTPDELPTVIPRHKILAENDADVVETKALDRINVSDMQLSPIP